MPLVGFETTTPVFELAKTVHALDRAAAVIGIKATTRLYPEQQISACVSYAKQMLTDIK
jgi:hypothetical protein